jgi:hypothetical protein
LGRPPNPQQLSLQRLNPQRLNPQRLSLQQLPLSKSYRSRRARLPKSPRRLPQVHSRETTQVAKVRRRRSP